MKPQSPSVPVRSALPFALAWTAALLSAQEPVFVQETDVVVARMQGPARIRTAFLATNVGTLLGAQESTDFWQLTRAAFRAQLRAVDASAGPNLAALVESLDSYAGEITLALSRTPHPEAWAGIEPDVGGVLILGPDGRTDLPAFAATIREGLRGSRLKVGSETFAGTEFDVVRTSERGGVVLPTMIGDRLITFFGENLEAAVAPRLAGTGAPFVADREFARAAFAFRVDLAAIVRDELARPSYEVASVDTGLFARVSGLASLREFRVLARPNGPHVELESSVLFVEGAPRGLFAGLMPDSTEPPALVGIVPPGARYWYAGKLRTGETFRAMLDSFAAYMASDEKDFERQAKSVRGGVRGFSGVDAGAEIFDRFTEDAVLIGSLTGRPDDADDVDPAQIGADDGTFLFACGTKDPSALEKAVERFFVGIGGLGREQEADDYAGARLHIDGDVCWAVSHGVFLFALGDEAEAWTVAMIDRMVALKGDPDAFAKPPLDVERRLRQAPSGYQGCGAFDAGALLGLPVFEIFDLQAELGDLFVDEWGRALADLRPFLSEHQLDRALALSGWGQDRWRYRVLW